MSSRYFWAALPALAAVALVTVGWLRWPRPQNDFNPVGSSTDNRQTSPSGKGPACGEHGNQGANSNAASEDGSRAGVGVNDRSSPQPDQPQPAANELLVKGRVVFSDGVGREVLEALGLDKIDLVFHCSELTGDEENEESSAIFLHAGLDGVIEQTTPRDIWPLDDKGNLPPTQWRIELNLGQMATLDPAPSPKLTGKVLDFGDLTFNFADTRSSDNYIVTGWIFHSSGAVAANVDYLGVSVWDGSQLPGDRRESDDDNFMPWKEFSVTTNAAGFFAVEIDLVQPKRYKHWYVGFTDFSEGMRPDRRPDHAFPCAPTIKGRVIDFNQVAINCGLVQARLSGLADEKTRSKVADLEGKAPFHPPTANIFFSGLDSTEIAAEFDVSGSAVVFLPRGPYDYYVSVDDPCAFYEPLEGSVTLDKGQVYPLELKLKQMASLVIALQSVDGATGARASITASWEALDGEWTETVAHSSILIGQTLRVPRRQNARLVVKASADDWQSTEVMIVDPQDVVTVEFRTRATPTTGKVIVKPPPPADWEQLAHLKLIIRRPGDPATEINASKEQALMAGVWEALLREENPYYGSPDAIACGPVAFTIVKGEATTVVLPSIPPPPWPQGCNGYRAMLTCEGRPFSYEGICKYSSNHTFFALDYGKGVGRAPLPCAVIDGSIMDGNTLVPLELVPPPTRQHEREAVFAEYRHDFPCRLEVRVTRQGRAVLEPLTIKASVLGVGVGGASYHCHASTVVADGKPFFLWLPPGLAQLSLSGHDFHEEGRTAEIRADVRAVVEWAVESSLLKLEWDPRYKQENGVQWAVYDDKGNVVNVVDDHTPQLSLKDGRYILRPKLLGQAKGHEIQIEMGGATEAPVIHIPYVAALIYDGEILLPYPQGLPLTARGYWFRMYWFSAAAGSMKQGMAELAHSQPSLDYRFTTDGIRVVDLPLKHEIVFLAAIAPISGEDNDLPGEQGWCMRPRLIRLELRELKKLSTDIWAQAAVLDSKWEYCVSAALKFTPVDNPYGVWYLGDGMEGWYVLPAGDYVVHVTPDEGEDKKPFELRLTLRSASGYFDLPVDIVARLTKEGLYDPPPDPGDG